MLKASANPRALLACTKTFARIGRNTQLKSLQNRTFSTETVMPIQETRHETQNVKPTPESSAKNPVESTETNRFIKNDFQRIQWLVTAIDEENVSETSNLVSQIETTRAEKKTLHDMIQNKIDVINSRMNYRYVQSYPWLCTSMSGFLVGCVCDYKFPIFAISLIPLYRAVSPSDSQYKLMVFNSIQKKLATK